MRTVNSAKNVLIVMLLNVISILVGFFSQRIFINYLGIEYLGINGLFSNILSMLSIVEMGLGTTIVYHMYKPVADKDYEKIKTLMVFYKTGYRVIALIVLALGILLIPFLKLIVVNTSGVKESVNLIYILCLLDIVFSYVLTYKRSILYATQKNYIVNIVHIGYLVLLNSFQILFLILTKNYIYYLILKIIFRLLENIIITIISNHMYPILNDNNVSPLDKKLKKDIITKIKGILFHKIGTFIVLGTDNIIISVLFGVKTVGLYDNYYLVISKIQTLISQFFSSITASVGNLLIENDINHSYKIYKNMLLFNSWIFVIATTTILCVIQPFITIWIGSDYLLPFSITIVFSINFYIQGMRITSMTFKNASGVFYEDRLMPIVEALTNIIVSIVLAMKFGLIGVFLGTISSTLILFVYGYYKYVYHYLFKKSYKQYALDYLPFLILPIMSALLTYFISYSITINNYFLRIVVNIILSCIIPSTIYYIKYRKSNELNYYLNILKSFFNKYVKENK